MTPEELWLLKEKWNDEKTKGFFVDCERLHSGEPLAYVIGHIPFLNSTIYLDSHPLIPRPETEFWVKKILEMIEKKEDAPIDVLDLCAGSGCIGVAVLKALPMTQVDFVEIDPHHHVTIQKNILENGINDTRTTILGGDLFENVHKTYDYILSNPPYIDPFLDRTESSVKEYEPHLALYGGAHGTTYIRKIIKSALPFLKPQGILVIEHEPEQADFIASYGVACGYSIFTMPDQYAVDRFTLLSRKDASHVPQ